MATTSPVFGVAAIGEVAGTVWRTLSDEGPTTLAQLVKSVGEPRDTVMQAVGWLAREGKIGFDDSGRNRKVFLQS
ncbi:MAG: winged helix-turn-helix domain-containing protein [Thermoguttaceae bacterium]